MKSTALKTVAAMGSTTLKAEAMPAGRWFIDQVKRKKGTTNVTMPRPIQSGIVVNGTEDMLLIRSKGRQTDKEMMLINIKL